MTLSPDDRILSVNQALCRIFGLSESELVGEKAWAFSPNAGEALKDRREQLSRGEGVKNPVGGQNAIELVRRGCPRFGSRADGIS
jgi:PAS domain S-box-containing protein